MEQDLVPLVSTSLNLWDEQKELLRKYAATKENCVVHAATGAGKTHVIFGMLTLWMLQRDRNPGDKSVVFVGNEAEAQQMYDNMVAFGTMAPSKIVRYTTRHTTDVRAADIIITTIATVTMTDPPRFTLVDDAGTTWVRVGDASFVIALALLDEAHKMCAKMASEKILRVLLRNVNRIVALTATNFRHKKGQWQKHITECLGARYKLLNDLSYERMRAAGKLKRIEAHVVQVRPQEGETAQRAMDRVAARLLRVHEHDSVLVKVQRLLTSARVAGGSCGRVMSKIEGEARPAEIMAVVRAVKEGREKRIVATDACNEGLDFGPTLNVCIEYRDPGEFPGPMAKENNSVSRVVQLVGRISRASQQDQRGIYYALCLPQQAPSVAALLRVCADMGVMRLGEEAPRASIRPAACAVQPAPPAAAHALVMPLPRPLLFTAGDTCVRVCAGDIFDLQRYVTDNNCLRVHDRAVRVANTCEIRPQQAFEDMTKVLRHAASILVNPANAPFVDIVHRMMQKAPSETDGEEFLLQLQRTVDGRSERSRIAQTFTAQQRYALQDLERVAVNVRKRRKKTAPAVAPLHFHLRTAWSAATALFTTEIMGAPQWARSALWVFMGHTELHEGRWTAENTVKRNPSYAAVRKHRSINAHLDDEHWNRVFGEQKDAPVVTDDAFIAMARQVLPGDAARVLAVLAAKASSEDSVWEQDDRNILRHLKSAHIVRGNARVWWLHAAEAMHNVASYIVLFADTISRSGNTAAAEKLELRVMVAWARQFMQAEQ